MKSRDYHAQKFGWQLILVGLFLLAVFIRMVLQ